MKVFIRTVTRAVVAAWIPAATVLGFTLAMAAEAANPEAPGIHLTMGVLSVIVGIVALVGPGFYLLGRYDHRLSSNESALLHVERQMETMVERSINTGERIANAVEALGKNGITIDCPGPEK
jgi:hypothetical protein